MGRPRYHCIIGEACVVAARCRGFTYIGILFVVALMGAALVSVAQVWHTHVQRDREAELLFVGNQFRRAIALYYERAPGGLRQYPKQLEDLLQDPRFPSVQRHLRKLYIDPMTGKSQWGLMKAADGSILGVYSLSEEIPIKTSGFSAQDAAFEDSISYREWKFVYVPEAATTGAKTAPGAQPGVPPGQVPPGGAAPSVGQPPGAAQAVASDPAQLQQLDMAARQPRCRAQRSTDLQACRQEGASTKDCITAAARRYEACLSGGMSQ